MIVVSDTSPIHYLVLIRAVHVLPMLFGEVLIPRTVASEPSHARAPDEVRAWFQSLPPWVKIRAPFNVGTIERLDPGEAEAIALTFELGADLLLIDDSAGKRAAKRLGIMSIGTLAILDHAAQQGMLDFRGAVENLEIHTNFRMPLDLRDRLIEEHKNRSG